MFPKKRSLLLLVNIAIIALLFFVALSSASASHTEAFESSPQTHALVTADSHQPDTFSARVQSAPNTESDITLSAFILLSSIGLLIFGGVLGLVLFVNSPDKTNS